MIRIGPYKLERISYTMVVNQKKLRVRNQLYITHDSGESAGFGPEQEAKLAKMLDEFWRQEF